MQTTSMAAKLTLLETQHLHYVFPTTLRVVIISPTLFNIYTLDVPTPLKHIQLITYADDITVTASLQHTISFKYQKHTDKIIFIVL